MTDASNSQMKRPLSEEEALEMEFLRVLVALRRRRIGRNANR